MTEKFHFLLKDVKLEQRKVFPKVDPVLYESPRLEANERQFFMSVPDIADYYSEDGKRVYLNWKEPLQKKSVELYLNGSVLGSILHQRNILALHGSSFQLEGRTVIICGDSGFGKSSITFTICKLYQAGFLTDDITPIRQGRIMQISERLKLWKDTLDELDMETNDLNQIYPEMDKYYVQLKSTDKSVSPDFILYGEIGGTEPVIEEIYGVEKFEKTFFNQYWKELTANIGGSREIIFKDISDLCNNVRMFRFRRPENILLEQSADIVVNFLRSI